MAFHSKPEIYDRHLWFREYFRRTGLQASKKEIEFLVAMYWQTVLPAAKPMPHALIVLGIVKRDYRIVIATDSDGPGGTKLERARKCGILDAADLFLVSDEIGINKPNKTIYLKIFKNLGIKPDECVMVGNNPRADLELAKNMGLATVWIKHGVWVAEQGRNNFSYVDYEINDLKELIGILKAK